jgi:hypothetical protein
MAFDTKLNLSDNKFEQLSGETLNLFGNTYIHGDFIINSGATFTILLNHGAGKVWTSDSGGTGTWQEPITGSSGTWGSITGVLSGQTDLQNALNSKLASGGTAVCATSAIDSKALCGCTPNCFLGINNCANDSAKLGNHLPSYYLSSGATAVCASDSAKLGGILPAGYLLSGGTAICTISAINSKALCGYTPASFLLSGGTAICTISAINSKALCGCVPASFLLSGGTAVCATSAIDSKALCGCTPNCFLGATACASDSAKLNNQLPAYYLNTGSTITCAADSAKLNNKLPAYYLNTGSTALCTTCAVGAKNLCGCVPASFLLSGGTAICATSAIDSKGLCGCIPNCFLGATACASDSAKLNNKLPTYYLNTGSTSINSLALCGCIPSCFLGVGATASDSSKLGGVLPAGYLLSGGTAICTTSAINSKALCGCIPSCFLGTTACATDSAKLGNHLPSYYLSTGGTVACANDSAKLGGILPAGYMLTGATYILTSPAVCTVGGVTAGRVLTGKTAFQLIEEILVPEICGTLTAPLTSIALAPSGTFEIGCSISVLCVTGTFSRGSISPQGCSTSAFRSGAANCYTFAGCQVVGSYACTTSPITKCAASYVVCATQTWTISTSYDCGVQPIGSKGTNFSSPLIAGTSNVASTTITGIYPYYWGKLTSGSRPAVTNSLVTGGTKVLAVSTGILAINFSSASNEYTWLAIPAATASKTCWYVNALDNGKVNNSPADKYPDECQICVSSGQLCWSNVCYKIYMSGVVGTISATLCFS